MADKVLFNVAGGILSSLAGPLVAGEFKMVVGVKRDLKKLRRTLSAIQAILLHAEELRATNSLVDHWLGRLNDAIYDADDLLDAVSTEVLRRKLMTQDKKAKKVRIFFSESNQLAFRLKMGHKIKEIRERLDDIAADIRDFNFVPHLVETPVKITGRDDTYSFVLKQHVIGRGNDTEAVITSLLDINIDESLSILPIVGIGGLGKTTLAQLVFNDERIQNFDLKMWVCVSDNFNVKIIVEKILESAKVKPKGDQMEQLVDCLRKEIVTRKFFLVLDDVWNEDSQKWFDLRKLLIDGIVGSKILITTRSDEVARITHTTKPHILKGLGKQESWDLFKKMAFNGEEPTDLSITKIGKEIVKKCGGVPLALEVIGGMLFGKNSVEKWVAFRNNQLPKISETTILPTLKLSYDILPSHLKHCFVYCSLFPKDYEFNKLMLTRLWIAQGFVESKQNRCLEDIADDYFMYLVARLFFQKDNFEVSSNVFKMHDLMHDLAILMAGSLIVTKFDNIREDALQKVRHISFHDLNNVSSFYKVSRTRTLIDFMDENVHEEIYEGLDFGKVISSFKLLRVLVCRNCCFGLNNIDRLIYLRYIDISGPSTFELPNSITRLINLETLILRCKELRKLPEGISNLVNLRHLENLDCYECRLPHEIVQLTNLQRLGSFALTRDFSFEHDAGFEELMRLKNLRGPLWFVDWWNGIKGIACESRMPEDLEVKSIFNVLKLRGWYEGAFAPKEYVRHPFQENFQRMEQQTDIMARISQSRLSSRPLSYLSTLTNLVELAIVNLPKCKHLSPLCQLPFLKEFHLCQLIDLEYILGCCDENQLSSSKVSKTFFPSLKFLKIDQCPNLRGWLWSNFPIDVKANNGGDNSRVEDCSPPMFSCLSKLSMRFTYYLVSMPLFPDTLEDLSLERVCWRPYLRPREDTSRTIISISLASSLCTPLVKLKKLQLRALHDITTLPMEGLQNLTTLENLEIHSLYDLKSLHLGLLNLIALKSLIVFDCKKLKFANDEDGVQWQGLENLLTIKFTFLPNLESLPWLLQRSTALENLCIEGCENLIRIPDWICNYESLKEIKIVKCSHLTYLPEGVLNFTSLENLELDSLNKIKPLRLRLSQLFRLKSLILCNCKELEFANDEDGVQWRGLENLLTVQFEKLPKLVSLPCYLQHATALVNLYIEDCENLTSIPDWLCNYKSLKELEIVGCYHLTYLPESAERLPSLDLIYIMSGHGIRNILRPPWNIGRKYKIEYDKRHKTRGIAD